MSGATRRRTFGEARPHWTRHTGNHRYQRTPQRFRNVFIVGYRKLKQWSETENEKLVTDLFGKRSDFIKVFNKPSVKEDWIRLSITILSKVAQSSADALKKQILMELSDQSPYWNMIVPNYLQQKKRYFNYPYFNNSDGRILLSELVKIVSTLIEYHSKYAISLPFQKLITFANEISETSAGNKLRKLWDQVRRPQSKDQPPNDYRQLPSFPTIEEILQETPSYLRPIKKNGRYIDVPHYLDIQFRLLKEDLVYPLREGIREMSSPNKNQDLKVYKGVEFVNINSTNSGLTFTIKFDEESAKGIFWKHTKKLIFGTLVCLSNDGFKTMVFASVAHRDEKELHKGMLDLRFLDGLQAYHYLTDKSKSPCDMVECPSYFEAYKHVLDGLKEIGNELPMKEYIIESESDPQTPFYVSRSTRYDLSSIISDGRNKDVYSQVPLTNTRFWPLTKSVIFNPSQFKAFHHALTNKFSIIQGPPGTGKTFVTLKITDALLRNKEKWQKGENGPMLLVCYTNHALDQFLNGLIEHGHENIIRVGGRADESLDKYLLKNKIQEQARESTGFIRKAKYESHKLRESIEDSLEPYFERLNTYHGELTNGKLLSFGLLQEFIPTNQRDYFKRFEQTFAESPFSVFDYFLNIYNLEKEEMVKGIGSTVTNTSLVNDFNKMSINQTMSPNEMVDVEGEGEALVERWAVDENEFARKKPKGTLRNTLEVSDLKRIITKDGFTVVLPSMRERKRRIQIHMKKMKPMTETEVGEISDPWSLPLPSRWRLYMYYVTKYNSKYFEQISNLADDFEEACQTLKELKEQEDEQVLRTADVIAMTTTCAARYRRILKNIGPKIVIIEEAAEVLEAHVVTSLTPSTEHVVLIGDHKQLRPNPTVFKLAKKFNLELSLFERMVNNNLKCQTLNVQHRMRPEISTLIRNVYPKLEDHPKVFKYPNVMGIANDIIFLSHDHPEQKNAQKSKMNTHEAEFLVALCKYLLQQGYQPNQITILTGYNGQLTTLKKLMPRLEFNGVRVTTVDNFQGEENDIILLSLVRSNDQGNIGFLGTENRVNVALSRAKHGLYVIGNFNLLEEKTLLWKKIVNDCRVKGYLATSIQLCCQNHPNTKLLVSNARDFKDAPDGGCTRKCTFVLKCGHMCWKKCHPTDPCHVILKCQTQCPNKCKQGHNCPKLCHYRTDCPPCARSVPKVLPKCGHRLFVACHKDPNDVDCHEICGKTRACGHTCKGKCNEECALVSCKEKVRKVLRCGHIAEVECSASFQQIADFISCYERIKVKLPCNCIQEIYCKNRRNNVESQHRCPKLQKGR